MLILKRRKGERITITMDGRLIADIRVMDCTRSETSLGIQAPPNVVVTRAEARFGLAKTLPDPPPTQRKR